jgi:hypothetical protein
LGSSLAAIETAGRQQSTAVIHRINLPIIGFVLSTLRLGDFYYADIATSQNATARQDQAGDSKARGLARQTVEPTP